MKGHALFLFILFGSVSIYAQTVITEPNPPYRYETGFVYQDLHLRKIDTMLEDFHRYQPTMQWDIPFLASNMGNVPRPLQFDIQNRIGFQDGYQALDRYFLHTDSVKYYDTKTPFTSAEYDFGVGDESYVKLTHAQNIKPYLNMAVDYKRPASKGFYQHQKSGLHNFSFSQWYRAPSNRYNWLSAYVFNQAKIEENGGVQAKDIFTNPAYSRDRSTAPVFLYDANNKINDHQAFFLQTIYLGSKVGGKDSLSKRKIQPKYGLSHQFKFHSRKIWYRDNEDSTGSFYSDFFISNDTTRDFTKVQTYQNEIFFQNFSARSLDDSSHVFKYSWKGGLRYSAHKYIQNTFHAWRHSMQLFGSIGNSAWSNQKYDYNIQASVELAPRYSGDFFSEVYFKFQPNEKFFISPALTVNTQSPSMKIERLLTNHVQWENKFKKQFALHANVSLGVPKWHIYTGVDYYFVQNYLYYNSDFRPEQFGQPFQVIRVFGEKNFYLKNFVFKNKIGYQFVSHKDILHQPKIYAKAQWYYRGSYIKKKPLHAQFGIDLTWFDNHLADAYQPAIMEYYLQNEESLKYYPLTDVFFSLHVKRTRLFLVMQNVLDGLFKEKGYYTHPNYPASPRALRVGVSWQFYD